MSYDVRPADLDADRADILRLWNGNLRDADTARYRWIYEHNPQGPIGCWVVTDGAAAVAGVAAAFPRVIQGPSRHWRGGVASDFVVDAAHRSIGPALMLQRTLAASCIGNDQFDVLLGFANKAASAVQVRAQFTDLGPATDLRKVIRSAAALTRRYGMFGRIAAPAVDSAMAFVERRSYISRGGVRCVEVSAFDARFDALWTRVAPGMPLTGRRTSAYLNWRFRDHPHIRHRILVAEQIGTSALKGYLVWYVRKDELIVADVLTDETPDTQLALIAQVLKDARVLGVESVRLRYFGPADRFRALERLGFRASESGRRVVMCVSPAAAASVPLERNSWYLLEGDADP
jgi:hypothetical protein